MAYSKEFYALYESLMNGEQYGKYEYWDYYHNRPLPNPGFSYNLYKSPIKPLFVWKHYGSSANKAGKRDLQWILTNIFHLSAKDFMKEYITRTEYNRIRQSINQCITENRPLL